MRQLVPLVLLAGALAGCGLSISLSPQASPTIRPAATPRSAALVVTPEPTPRPAPPPKVGAPYRAFLASMCRAFAARNADAVIGALPYYQYNSGLYYGILGSGEGQTSDPSLLRTWLASSHVRCRYLTPDTAGHGTVLTSGWPMPGGWSLIDVDTFNGHWKINDFTFGPPGGLWRAMHAAGPILGYHG